MAVPVSDAAGLRRLVGQHLGFSSWLTVSQDRVDRFAEATEDRQWIHVEPARAATSRFGGPVVHGALILSLTSHLLNQILEVRGFAMVVNYGCERVRFLAPVPVGSQLRAGARLRSVEEVRGGVQFAVTMEFGMPRRLAPVCVARVLLRAYH